jgi:hypothetical protein
MIFSGQLDGSFVGLDQKTGKLLWRTQLEDYHDGYSITGATRYFDGMVFLAYPGRRTAFAGGCTRSTRRPVLSCGGSTPSRPPATSVATHGHPPPTRTR